MKIPAITVRTSKSVSALRGFASLLILLQFASATVSAQGLFERFGFGGKKDATLSPNGAQALQSLPSLAGLSEAQVAAGLKSALSNGVHAAVGKLGVVDGFLKDEAVRIPMPENLKRVETTLRKLKQTALADEFVTTMNRAAEKAVPEAAAVLADSLSKMTLADAKAILLSTNNAATDYFRRTSTNEIHARFLPIVQQATEQTGVTGAYKRIQDELKGQKLGGLGGLGAIGSNLMGFDQFDLDGYVTSKCIEGLFLKIGVEEKRIRETTTARTTDLLRQVFGAVSKQ